MCSVRQNWFLLDKNINVAKYTFHAFSNAVLSVLLNK